MVNAPETNAVVEIMIGTTRVYLKVGTVLECLQACEQNGQVPPLSDAWKSRIPEEHRVLLEDASDA